MHSLLKTEKSRAFGLFTIVVLGAAFGNLSQTALNAMMHNIVADLGVTMAVGQWLTTVYMLVFGITVPLATFLAKRLSEKNLVYLASGFSLVGVVIAVFSWDFPTLFVGRVFQAVSTGILLPMMQTAAMTKFPKNQRATAMGVAGIAMGVAPTLGPTLGGLMDYLFGWRSFFVLLLAIALVLLVAAALLIEPGAVPDRSARFDALSYSLSALGFGGLLLAFSDASSFDLASPFVWLPLALGALCLVLFVLRQNRMPEPLISMRIFKSRQYTSGFMALNLMFVSHMGVMLILSLYITDICGGSSLDAGLTLLPGIFCAIIASPLAGYLSDRYGIRPVTLAGGALFLLGTAAMVFCNETTPLIVPTAIQTVRSLGVSCLVGPITSWTLAGLGRDKVADGSSFLLAVRQTVASLGTSAMVFILVAGAASGLAPVLTYQLAFAFSAVVALIAFGYIVFRVR